MVRGRDAASMAMKGRRERKEKKRKKQKRREEERWGEEANLERAEIKERKKKDGDPLGRVAETETHGSSRACRDQVR